MVLNTSDYIKYIKNRQTPFYSFPTESNMYSDEESTFESYPYDSNVYESFCDRDWHYMMCNIDELPIQGWKIHISANIEDSKNVLRDVSKHLIEKKISFKYVPSEYDLLLTYSKSADRIEAGKFITIYPKDDEEFCGLLDPLMNITSLYKEGPYILNDCSWKESNVYFRYGAFKKMVFLQEGVPVYAIKKPSGEYTQDKRVPFYTVPNFVTEPNYVKENNKFPDSRLFSKLEELNIDGAIHFSNGGGIYEGKYNGKPVVIKEGRPYIGLDSYKNDGFTRIKSEYKTLKKLVSIDGVVKELGYKKIWKHNYLIEEKLSGCTLGEFVALNFPFPNDVSTDTYKNMCIKIIQNLVTILKNIHATGFSVVDFQPENIMIDIQGEEVKKITLIDFESAEELNNVYKPNLITPDYNSFQSKTFEDGDWFSLYRIARSLFLPVETTMIYTKEFEDIQNINIEQKFGTEVISFLNQIRDICEEKTVIYRNSSFYEKSLSIPTVPFDKDNLKQNIHGLIRGLVNNLNFETENLISGDIKQYDNPLSKYAITNGAFGVLMSLDRAGIELDTTKLFKWIDDSKENIIKILNTENETDVGLFTGVTGISLVMLDLGKYSYAVELFNYCKPSEKLDISLYSGISGLAFTNIAFYIKTNNKTYLKNASNIADDIIGRFSNENFTKETDYEGKLGLIKGWSGAVLFLWKFGILLDKQEYKSYAITILNRIISEGVIYANDGYALADNTRGIVRLLPYLDTGFVGLSLLLMEIEIDDDTFLTNQHKKILNSIKKDTGTFCTYYCSLFSGLAGIIVGSNCISKCYGENTSLYTAIKALNDFALSSSKDETLLPGLFGEKCSMDYETGAAGVLLSLLDIEKNKDSWYSWFPLPKDNPFNLFCTKKSEKLML